MGILHDDVVIIGEAEKEGKATVITVNCPDKTGLGCDLCRIILFFGLSIVRGDVSTDGKWCYIVFWVVGKQRARWSLLKKRLIEACPSCSSASGISYYRSELQPPKPPDVFLLKFCCHDRKGLLHDVTEVLSELELIIHKVKVSTTPDGKVVDLFFITDTRELLHTKKRRDDTIEQLSAILGDPLITIDIELVGPEIAACSQASSFLPSAMTEDMFDLELPGSIQSGTSTSDSVSITMDNSLSPAHTLVQIICQDHKGLLYDIMRTLKDYNIQFSLLCQVTQNNRILSTFLGHLIKYPTTRPNLSFKQISYGRFSTKPRGKCELDLFIMQADGKKIVNPSKQKSLSSRLRMELLRPLRVTVVSRGPDTELLVANPVELSGKGRPLVFYDITHALKMLGPCIFSAEVGRHVVGDREWEVYRILLDEGDGLSVPRNKIEKGVWKMLMGWE
ncbi:ACT domain-containing protein ACR10 [Glycine soja]|nr:ACT domain-containing protein ACR10 [Glycine max]